MIISLCYGCPMEGSRYSAGGRDGGDGGARGTVLRDTNGMPWL